MGSQWKERLLRIWEKLLHFAKWCDKHGFPKIVAEAVLKAFLWWLKRR